MAMPPGAEGGVFCLAERVPQYGNAGPVIDGILQALVCGRLTIRLLPERRVTGATPHRHLRA